MQTWQLLLLGGGAVVAFIVLVYIAARVASLGYFRSRNEYDRGYRPDDKWRN
jgi:hypothetical protein